MIVFFGDIFAFLFNLCQIVVCKSRAIHFQSAQHCIRSPTAVRFRPLCTAIRRRSVAKIRFPADPRGLPSYWLTSRLTSSRYRHRYAPLRCSCKCRMQIPKINSHLTALDTAPSRLNAQTLLVYRALLVLLALLLRFCSTKLKGGICR